MAAVTGVSGGRCRPSKSRAPKVYTFVALRRTAAGVVAHQVELVHVVLVGRVDRNFGRRKREDEPAVARVDRWILEHVAEETAVGPGDLAVHHDVEPRGHCA